MTDPRRGARFFGKAADKFIFRLAIYSGLVLLVGFIAFTADLFLDQHELSLIKQASADGIVSGLAMIVGLCFLEVFLFGRSGWKGQIEAKAWKAENMLATVLQTIPDLVFIKDADGRHLMVNKAAEEFTGHTAQHFYGKTMADLMPPARAASCMQSDREPIVTGKTCRIEERFSNAAGLRILDTIKTPLRDDRGAIVGLVGVSRDITEKSKAEEERQRLQAQVLKAQKMEALGHLAGGIAHDFNNVLTVIVGYASVLKIKLAKDDELVHQAEQILLASERAKKLARGLVAFSSKQKIETKQLNVNDLINRSRRLLTHFIGDRVSIRISCCDAPLTVMADQSQLDRVLMNLAANAQDAMPDGGDLIFSTDTFEMGDSFAAHYGYGVPGSYAHLMVSDTGTGISEENMRKIFEPFFTTKEEGKGTGLGLAIVYGIIKQHGGFINVSSKPDRGTTFHVYLPLAQGGAQ